MGMLNALRKFFGKPTKQDLLNKYYTAKIQHNYKAIRDIANALDKIKHK